MLVDAMLEGKINCLNMFCFYMVIKVGEYQVNVWKDQNICIYIYIYIYIIF